MGVVFLLFVWHDGLMEMKMAFDGDLNVCCSLKRMSNGGAAEAAALYLDILRGAQKNE